MPHWNDKGEEEWVCQKGAHICTGESIWVRNLGNVCPACAKVSLSVEGDGAAYENFYIRDLTGKPVAGPFRSKERADIAMNHLLGNRQNSGPCPERTAGPDGNHVYLDDGLCRFCGRQP